MARNWMDLIWIELRLASSHQAIQLNSIHVIQFILN